MALKAHLTHKKNGKKYVPSQEMRVNRTIQPFDDTQIQVTNYAHALVMCTYTRNTETYYTIGKSVICSLFVRVRPHSQKEKQSMRPNIALL